MRSRIGVLLVVAAACCAVLASRSAALFVQTGITGTWRSDTSGSRPAWRAVFRVDGTRLIGAVSLCSPQRAEIFDGVIEGSTIRFKCTSTGGERVIAFVGSVNAEAIALTWELHTKAGGDPASDDQMFGSSLPPRFTVRRAPDVPDAVTAIAENARKAPAVTFDQILQADRTPQNWLTYSGSLSGQRTSALSEITRANVNNLELAWLWQTESNEKFEATPLVVDGVLYTVQAPNDVVALNAFTGRVLWKFSYTPAPSRLCCGRVNRGLAVLGGTLFMGTIDAHLIAIDAYSGKLVWDTAVIGPKDTGCSGGRPCHSITNAPLIVKDKVIVGVAGGDVSGRGFIAAFDARSGQEVWRFYTVPSPGEPGNETWIGDSWKTGGAGVWITGTFDPELNLTYWGTGNPCCDSSTYTDALYSDSVVALDAETGKLKWYYQFTPHDRDDTDAAQVPVLTNIEWQGRVRKAMLFVNKNGLMYILDRGTGEFLMAKTFTEVTWISRFDEKGQPIRAEGRVSAPGTPWAPPSYSPNTGLLYVPTLQRGAPARGRGLQPTRFIGGGSGGVGAFDPRTGEKTWEFKTNDSMFHGILTSASNLLFVGADQGCRSPLDNTMPIQCGLGQALQSLPDPALRASGRLYALDAEGGQLLWQTPLTGAVHSVPMTYSAGGKQFVAISAGNTLFAFALRQ